MAQFTKSVPFRKDPPLAAVTTAVQELKAFPCAAARVHMRACMSACVRILSTLEGPYKDIKYT